MPEDMYQLMLKVTKRDLSQNICLFRDSPSSSPHKAGQTRQLPPNPDRTFPDPYLLKVTVVGG